MGGRADEEEGVRESVVDGAVQLGDAARQSNQTNRSPRASGVYAYTNLTT